MSNQESVRETGDSPDLVEEAAAQVGEAAVEDTGQKAGSTQAEDSARAKKRRLPKGKLEAGAIVIMVLGFLMIFQGFSATLYNYSFIVILIGTIMFIIVSHFPEDD